MWYVLFFKLVVLYLRILSHIWILCHSSPIISLFQFSSVIAHLLPSISNISTCVVNTLVSKLKIQFFHAHFFFSVSSRKTSWCVALSIIPFIYSVSCLCILIICILSSFYKITFSLNQIIWLIILCSTGDEIQDTIHFRLAFYYWPAFLALEKSLDSSIVA